MVLDTAREIQFDDVLLFGDDTCDLTSIYPCFAVSAQTPPGSAGTTRPSLRRSHFGWD